MGAAATRTCVLMGSKLILAAETWIVNAAPTGNENKVFAAGSIYGHHSTAALSYLDLFAALIASHTDITTVTVKVQEDRKLVVTSDTAFTLDFNSNTILRDLGGFTGNLTPSNTVFRSPNIPQFLWSPDRTEDPSAALGSQGRKIWEGQDGEAPGGNTIRTRHTSKTVNDFTFPYIAIARLGTDPDSGSPGEYAYWWENFYAPALRWVLFRLETDDESSTTPMDLDEMLGPYKPRAGSGLDFPWDREQSHATTDAFLRVELNVNKVPEYT